MYLFGTDSECLMLHNKLLLPHLSLILLPDPINNDPIDNFSPKLTLILVNIQSVASKKQALWESTGLPTSSLFVKHGCLMIMKYSLKVIEPKGKIKVIAIGGILIGVQKKHQSEFVDSDNHSMKCMQ